MAPKGSPRDMNKWRETLRDPNIDRKTGNK
jgi:hypothetical protein